MWGRRGGKKIDLLFTGPLDFLMEDDATRRETAQEPGKRVRVYTRGKRFFFFFWTACSFGVEKKHLNDITTGRKIRSLKQRVGRQTGRMRVRKTNSSGRDDVTTVLRCGVFYPHNVTDCNVI